MVSELEDTHERDAEIVRQLELAVQLSPYPSVVAEARRLLEQRRERLCDGGPCCQQASDWLEGKPPAPASNVRPVAHDGNGSPV
jgi:hypothetical protein